MWRELTHDVPDDFARVAMALRLWAGCLLAAKTITFDTRSGPNTLEMRGQLQNN